MYAEHFGFSKPPFSVTPDPQVFFENSVYREAFAKLQYGVAAKKGFVVVTGEVGTGKTTLLRKLLHGLGPTVHSVFIFNTQVSFVELLRLILDDLGLARHDDDKLNMIEVLNRYLMERLRQGHIVTLLIDEAQNLSDEALEGLRLLSNLETDTQKLLQIVLMGQPELERKLDQPKLRQLKQRIILHCRLTPLKKEDVGAYIDFRLKAAGYRGKNLFDHASLEAIALYSRGVPRLVNIICDNALVAAFAAAKQKVSVQMVEELARALRLSMPQPIDTRHPVHHKMPANPAKPRAEEKPPPEFENVFVSTDKRHWPGFHRKHRLMGWGVGMFVGAVFLGGIAVSYPQQSKIYPSDWTARLKEFMERAGAHIAESAMKAGDLSVQSKDYLSAQSGDFFRQSSHYLAGLLHKAEDFSRQSHEDLAGLAARTGEGVRSHWKGLQQVNPVTQTSKENSSNVSLADSNAANSSKQTEPFFGHPARVVEKPLVNQESKESKEKREGSLQATASAVEAEVIKNNPTPAESRAITDSAKAQQSKSSQLVSVKPESSALEHPNERKAPYLGTFEVVENSFVRDKPQDDAEIITTLQPGSRVQVESKSGRYLRVRSLNETGVHGYVHEEDAFFKRVK